ncbi:unnamed protein product [Didymodactylos carnosus]|uniref:Uncharacterized protein n=1 Tax=Didymodactylos carnosus TaxID=1234261 RepID=A0A8S2G4R0_9BILA|nr:unnamed protein product [Didymodactylos carnosus]CAF4444407.1 unnamed protein product [Didymodactylos carnosus]
MISSKIEKVTSDNGKVKLNEENIFLKQSLQSLKNFIKNYTEICELKQDEWNEFQLRLKLTNQTLDNCNQKRK